jgi:hypothetical protein
MISFASVVGFELLLRGLVFSPLADASEGVERAALQADRVFWQIGRGKKVDATFSFPNDLPRTAYPCDSALRLKRNDPP